MSKYQATATLDLDFGRLAGDADDDADAAAAAAELPPDPAAGAAVVVAAKDATVTWRGTVSGGPIEITIRATGKDRPQALQRASAVAKQVQAAVKTRSMALPLLRALVPPQAAAAVRAAGAIVKLARSGKLKGWLKRLRGGAKVLAQAVAGASE